MEEKTGGDRRGAERIGRGEGAAPNSGVDPPFLRLVFDGQHGECDTHCQRDHRSAHDPAFVSARIGTEKYLCGRGQ